MNVRIVLKVHGKNIMTRKIEMPAVNIRSAVELVLSNPIKSRLLNMNSFSVDPTKSVTEFNQTPLAQTFYEFASNQVICTSNTAGLRSGL